MTVTFWNRTSVPSKASDESKAPVVVSSGGTSATVGTDFFQTRQSGSFPNGAGEVYGITDGEGSTLDIVHVDARPGTTGSISDEEAAGTGEFGSDDDSAGLDGLIDIG